MRYLFVISTFIPPPFFLSRRKAFYLACAIPYRAPPRTPEEKHTDPKNGMTSVTLTSKACSTFHKPILALFYQSLYMPVEK